MDSSGLVGLVSLMARVVKRVLYVKRTAGASELQAREREVSVVQGIL